MPNKLMELLSSIMGELKKISTTETVVGEPVKMADKMIVPVTRITIRHRACHKVFQVIMHFGRRVLT